MVTAEEPQRQREQESIAEQQQERGGHVEQEQEGAWVKDGVLCVDGMSKDVALRLDSESEGQNEGTASMYPKFGVATSMGGRLYQDDRCTMFCFYTKSGEKVHVGAVMDGHHGSEMSDMVADRLPDVLVEAVRGADSVEAGLEETVEILDRAAYDAYKDGVIPTGGTTILILLIVSGKVYTANVGDCKAVLSSKGAPEALTEAHNPPVLSEKMRFEDAGVPCFSDHIGGSDINVCRTLGDYDLGEPLKWRCPGEGDEECSKVIQCGPLSSEPEINVRDIEDIDEFIVIATDGVWDYFTPESSVVTHARRQLRLVESDDDACSLCASWIVNAALSRQREVLHSGTPGDNTTVLLVQLRDLPGIPRARASRLNLRREVCASGL